MLISVSLRMQPQRAWLQSGRSEPSCQATTGALLTSSSPLGRRSWRSSWRHRHSSHSESHKSWGSLHTRTCSCYGLWQEGEGGTVSPLSTSNGISYIQQIWWFLNKHRFPHICLPILSMPCPYSGSLFFFTHICSTVSPHFPHLPTHSAPEKITDKGTGV